MGVLINKASGGVALTVIRYLGKKGVDVTAASSTPSSLSFYSKYCKHRLLYPHQKEIQKNLCK